MCSSPSRNTNEMSGKLEEKPVLDENRKELTTYTLPQLRAKIAENVSFKSNLCYLADSVLCRFEKCDQAETPNQIGTKLHMGSYTEMDNGSHTVWAYIYALHPNKSPGVKTSIGYVLDNGVLLKPNEVRRVRFVEPFNVIKGVDQSMVRDKIRWLALLFFLERGYSNSITFSHEGFENFRRAVAAVAKARTQAKLGPLRPSLVLGSLQQPSIKFNKVDAASEAQSPAVAPPSDSATTPKNEATAITSSSTKRKRSQANEDLEAKSKCLSFAGSSIQLGLLKLSRVYQEIGLFGTYQQLKFLRVYPEVGFG